MRDVRGCRPSPSRDRPGEHLSEMPTDLRTCKNCRNFDTGAQFECTQPIPERITKKDVRNTCDFFVARASIERETHDSGGSVVRTKS